MGLIGFVGKAALMGISAAVGYKYAEYKRENFSCIVKDKYDDDSWDDRDKEAYQIWADNRTLEQLDMCKHCPCADMCEFSAADVEIQVVDRLRAKVAEVLFDLSIKCDPSVLDSLDECDGCDGDCANCDCECDCDECEDEEVELDDSNIEYNGDADLDKE